MEQVSTGSDALNGVSALSGSSAPVRRPLILYYNICGHKGCLSPCPNISLWSEIAEICGRALALSVCDSAIRADHGHEKVYNKLRYSTVTKT